MRAAPLPSLPSDRCPPTGKLLAIDDLLASPFVHIGSIDHIVVQLIGRRERLGISYYVVFDKDMDVFAPIVGRPSGV